MFFNSLGFGDRHLTIEVTPVDISDSDDPLTHGIEYDFHALTISKDLPFVFVTSTPLNHNYSVLNPHYHPDLMPRQHFPFKVTLLCGKNFTSVALQGFEPQIPDPNSDVLPLHQRALINRIFISRVCWIRTSEFSTSQMWRGNLTPQIPDIIPFARDSDPTTLLTVP